MTIRKYILPKDADYEPCPMGCGGMTYDPGGGPCDACWRKFDEENQVHDDEDYHRGVVRDGCYCDDEEA